jgi:tetratricopeptide (TPR) repeat protein
MGARRFGRARERLARIAQSWTNQGEVPLLLGECELELKHHDQGLAALAQVDRSSPHFGRAALMIGTHRTNTGRYGPAEAVLVDAIAQAPEASRFELQRALCRLYRFEGRFHDVRRLIRASWYQSPNPAATLKELWALDHSPMPVESWNRALEVADADDDRVWLGRANNAVASGRFDEASGWLDRCAGRKPDDPAVWQSRLDLAQATTDIAGFRSAARHLPANLFDAGMVHTMGAWLAARAGDGARERSELSALLTVEPGNATALERLSVLMFQDGRTEKAKELQREKGEADRARDTYRKLLYDGHDLSSRADLAAKLMRTLGRAFDAEAWSIVAAARLRDPDPLPARSTPASPLGGAPLVKAKALSAQYATAIELTASAGQPLVDRFAGLLDSAQPDRPSGDADRAGPHRDAPTTTSQAQFVDDAASAGLQFTFDNGQTAEHLLPETMSGGVALLDFDGDGWLDVYCVQGGSLSSPANEPGKTAGARGDMLFRNRGDGTFDDVTESAGIARIARGRGYGLGVTIGDYDNDGRPDLFVTRLLTYALYRNRGDGTFEDVTERTGLAGRRDNPTSAAFADLDNDGDLDLYVCHYMIWDAAHPRTCRNEKGEYFYCDPSKVEPAPDHVFRNDAGRFVDVTNLSGCVEKGGRGLGVVAADIDDDNRVDLYVANDGTANNLFHNRGKFRFEEAGLEAGVAGSADGGYRAGMGVACGDIDGDGRPDLMVTNCDGAGVTFYQNLGQGLFADRSAASGIGLATRYLLGFGIAMVDVTNNGRLDVMIANGHVNDNRPYYPYAMPSRLYMNRPDGRFVDASTQAGAPWSVERIGRGLAAGDLDNDGRVDAVVLSQNEPVAFFHNRSRAVGRFITFRLEGTKSNRDGVGARVTVVAGRRRQVAQRWGGGSYQSSSDPRLHFGLGGNDRVETVEVRWPSGTIDRWSELAAGRGYVLREGSPIPLPLAGFSPGRALAGASGS